ncbi:Uu.00g069910.m01.CDS01 [Anthostomella pinea]|uniref:Uu.00g069910.m01.CDS01 n=1 Tax=Anthostomella pinea TaxID=933095 RepID=A0AAI8VNZ9_9PEZI|nr:Uu.00g069910.m01.CDS01 [Anthostomella pinea]
MSGLEVAGLVLGALPLVITALEHYESSIDHAKAFYKYEYELERTMSELWMEHLNYDMTLKTLLMGITSPLELEEMMNQPDSPLWKSNELAAELQDKLGVAYNAYLHIIKQMEKQVKDLFNALSIDRQPLNADDLESLIKAVGQPAVNRNSISKFEFRRRVKFTWNKKKITRLLGEVEDCNKRLELFIEKAEKMNQSTATTGKSGPKSTLAIPLQMIHDYAGRLHDVFSRALNGCTQHSHHASLLLEHRMIRAQKKKGLKHVAKDEDQTFLVSFQSPSNPKAWHNAEIQISKGDNSQANLLGPRATQPKVKFAMPPSVGGNVVATLSTPPVPLPLAQAHIISDLCSTLQSREKQLTCSGFWLDIQGILRGTYQAPDRPSRPTGAIITLEDLLVASKSAEWKPLTQEDRHVLAITLSSSFLQLHKTPWLGNKWDKKAIFFSRTANDQHRIDVRHPFITKTYAAPTHLTTSATIPLSTATPAAPRDNTNLLTLAQILLEVHLKDRLENKRRDDDLGPDDVPNAAGDLQTLQRWIMEQQENLSFELKDAVLYCMKCSIDPTTDLGDLGVRQGVVDSVVAPLLEELYTFREGHDR